METSAHTHIYIYQLLRHAKRSNLQWPGCWTSGQTFGILNARFGSGTRYSLQTSSPNTGVEWQSALRGVFFLRSLWPIFLFGTIFCLWNEPAIGNLPHFGALLPPISCLLFYHGHSYFVLATWGGVHKGWVDRHGLLQMATKSWYTRMYVWIDICKICVYKKTNIHTRHTYERLDLFNKPRILVHSTDPITTSICSHVQASFGITGFKPTHLPRSIGEPLTFQHSKDISKFKSQKLHPYLSKIMNHPIIIPPISMILNQGTNMEFLESQMNMEIKWINLV